MRALHFTTDRGESAQIPISDRAASAMIQMGRASEVPEGEGDIAFGRTPHGLGVILAGVIEAVAEQAKLAVVAQAGALAHEAEVILDRTTDEQIATGEKLLEALEAQAPWPGSRYRSGGYERPHGDAPHGSYGIHVRSRPSDPDENIWWDSRIIVWGEEGGDAEVYRDIILRLLQAAESEAIHGRDLLRAPSTIVAYEERAEKSREWISELERENAALRERLEPKLEEPNPAGVFAWAADELRCIAMRGPDGLMRRSVGIPSTAELTAVEANALRDRILKLLQTDEIEDGQLAGMPKAFREAHAKLKERDKRISDLEVMNLNLTNAMEKVSTAAGARPAEVDLATHVGNLLLSCQFGAKDGYTNAFYQMAEMIGVQGPQNRSPRDVFEGEVLPKLRDLVRFWKSNVGKPGCDETDPSPRADRGRIVAELAEALGIPDTGTARAIDFFRRELLPAVLTLKTYGDVHEAFNREERKVLRDRFATEAMKILIAHGFASLDARSEVIARKSFAMADDMLKARG